MKSTFFRPRPLTFQAFLLLASVCGGGAALAGQKDAVAAETIALPGLREPVEILVDRWGVPHIYAKNEADLFFAQGFNAARDRLFQIDLWRRRGLGQLSEAFGPAYVEQDKATRLFLYRGDMKKEWAVYSADSEQIAQNFAAGVNAYIDWLNGHPDKMPIEFKMLNYKPVSWAAEDVVRIQSHGLTGNLTDEVARARVACAADLKWDEIRFKLEPPWQTRVPEGLDPCLPKDVLKVFDLATQNVRFTPGSMTGVSRQPLAAPSDDFALQARAESNNWVIAAKKSATGHAIMANDPHRAYTEPSIRYIADLDSPTLHVTGIGEPAVPGVSNGHNDWMAFGGTYFSIDQEDLYVYELNSANANEYKYKGQWESFRVVHDDIKVKGQAPIPVALKFTRHGPLIYVQQEKNRAFAQRTVWLEPGTAPYYVSVDYMRAKTFEQFTKAINKWGTPPINHVYADVGGKIGWAPGGFAPIRANWDGLQIAQMSWRACNRRRH